MSMVHHPCPAPTPAPRVTVHFIKLPLPDGLVVKKDKYYSVEQLHYPR